MLLRIFGPEREKDQEEPVENYIVERFVICTLCQTLFGWSNQGGWSGL